MAAPPEVPEALVPWKDIVRLVRDAPEKLAKLRLKNYRKDADNRREFPSGLTMDPDVYASLVSYIRPLVGFAIPPIVVEAPAPPAIMEAEFEGGSVQKFRWQWYDIPFTWTDDDGMLLNSFPLPVATLLGPPVGGSQHVFSMTALWKLWSQHISSSPNQFVGKGSAKRWQLWETLGLDHDGHVCHSKQSLGMQRRVARLSGGPLPAAQDYSFGQCMVSPGLFVGILVWFARWQSQEEDFQKTAHTLLQHLCRLLPAQCTFQWEGIAFSITNGRIACSSVKGLLTAVGILGLWHQSKIFKRPRLNEADDVSVHKFLWTVFRGSGQTPEALRLCGVLVAMLTEALKNIGPRLHNTLPACRLS